MWPSFLHGKGLFIERISLEIFALTLNIKVRDGETKELGMIGNPLVTERIVSIE